MFLGRSISSDQSFIGLPNGNVTRARAIVRLVPEARWKSELALAVTMTPFNESPHYLDKLEDGESPHEHAEPEVGSESRRRRVRIMLSDLKKHGFSPHCPRCGLHQSGQHSRARFHKHTEACRARLYRAFADSGSPKYKYASMDGEDRIATRASTHASAKSRRRRRPQSTEHVRETAASDIVPDQDEGELFGPEHLFGKDDEPVPPTPLDADEGIALGDTSFL